MPDPQSITAQIAAIKQRVADYWHDEQAGAAASALWGGGDNEHGVFTHGQAEVVAKELNERHPGMAVSTREQLLSKARRAGLTKAKGGKT